MPEYVVTPYGNIAARTRSDNSMGQKNLIEGPNEQLLYVAVGSAVVTSMPAGTSVVTLLSSLSSRRRVFIFNAADAPLYVKLGAAASLTSYSFKIDPDGYWEMPAFPAYTGDITGIWSTVPGSGAAPTGAAKMTEM